MTHNDHSRVCIRNTLYVSRIQKQNKQINKNKNTTEINNDCEQARGRRPSRRTFDDCHNPHPCLTGDISSLRSKQVLLNDRLAGDTVILGSTHLHVSRPCRLQGFEDPHVERLEFVSHVRGDTVKNDRGSGDVEGKEGREGVSGCHALMRSE